ncbi:hypothetical protein NBT05_06680 [Aquimarina sp. ERC-38]|uniref:hypothetical protein n=1 Tax=Aquimarina sp. ERC-38 TaxID=2949996 RepID=UPI00224792A1|nr:hypothetical protein [Aquimarina sp. ERC-38]UZO82152.1 hypothetical protein NBT05_06680 [Aquimarina sp. ERC-38]
MKKTFLLLFMIGFGFTIQAQEDWKKLPEIYKDIYGLATELNRETDKVTAQSSIISIATDKGTVSLEERLDKTKPAELKFYQYYLLTSEGKQIHLQKMNAKRVLESFQVKLLQVKDQLRENQDGDVEDILNSLFN